MCCTLLATHSPLLLPHSLVSPPASGCLSEEKQAGVIRYLSITGLFAVLWSCLVGTGITCRGSRHSPCRCSAMRQGPFPGSGCLRHGWVDDSWVDELRVAGREHREAEGSEGSGLRFQMLLPYIPGTG